MFKNRFLDVIIYNFILYLLHWTSTQERIQLIKSDKIAVLWRFVNFIREFVVYGEFSIGRG